MNIATLLAVAVTAALPPSAPIVQTPQSGSALVVQVAKPELATSTAATINAAYTLRNATPDSMTLVLGDLMLNGAARKTTWRRLDSNQAVTELTLAPQASLTVLLHAEAASAGLYIASIRPKGQAGEVGAVLIDRQRTTPKPADILTPAAPPVSTVLGQAPRLRFRVRNGGEQGLALKPPAITSLGLLVDGQITEGIELNKPVRVGLNCGVRADPAGLTTLAPGETCDATLTLPEVGAGQYEAQILVGGPEGEPATASLRFMRRLPFWLALIIALGGSAVGVGVQWWRNTGRRRVRGLTEIRRLLSSAQSLVDRASDLGRDEPGTWIRHLEELAGEVEAGRLDAWETSVQEARRRLELVESWLDREEKIQTLGLAGAALEAARAEAASVIASPTSDNTAAMQALEALRVAMVNAQPQILAAEIAVAGAGPQVAKTSLWATLSRYRVPLDWLAMAAIWIVAGLLAVQTTWANDPAWGSLGDILTLLAVSLGIQTGSATTLATLFDQSSLDFDRRAP